MSRDLVADFLDWDRTEPGFYNLFKQFAFELINAGKTRGSANRIVERIRWDVDTLKSDETWKVNNNHRPYLSRMFKLEFPQYADFFGTRLVKAHGDSVHIRISRRLGERAAA